MSRIIPLHRLLVVVLLTTICHHYVQSEKAHDKYTKHANALPDSEIYDPEFRNIQRPFRMSKLNLVWTKAQHRLTEPKLKSLYTELKIHDKEEITYKQLKEKDKDGLKEAELRNKLVSIMSTYGLLEHFDDSQDPEKYQVHKSTDGTAKKDTYKNKTLFKDKKLNRLWEKAESAGFSKEELDALREEFDHHQTKIDVYYNLLERLGDEEDKPDTDAHRNAVNEDEQDRYNEVDRGEEQAPAAKQHAYLHKSNQLREKHREIRDNFDRLDRISSKGPNSQDFVEPKVQGLWRVALASDFSADELASLKVELLHYESRLLKLRHMHAEHALSLEKHKQSDAKADTHKQMEDNIKKQTRKVEKFQEEIERRIFKHSEL
ncbi:alpha-2-macroglobulin receptor-associated protein [Anopheles ziemanni]|uniref:alpha-2-macroglobulin receptor-associated protein n=1 Tax=Anopheles coustani TaxID=139045 RepID=UPI002659C5CD|nr:alpha-2-macroglobulin receptor-associated protein [Anopheles coustani]XP_058169458.1 alpha-2-macroglobulin receptor-associated protein [Anopheles ziemanni]